MNIHPRHELIVTAELELRTFVSEWAKKHGLTLAEELHLIAELLHRQLGDAVRSERRSDEEKAT